MTASAVLATALAQQREQPGAALGGSASDLVVAAAAMARRFRAGGVLHAFGDDGADAHHIAVEFVHPVIVGKRALPALAHDLPRAAHRLRHTAGPGDIALAVCGAHAPPGPDLVAEALAAAAGRGLLTVALTGPDAAGRLPAERPPLAAAALTGAALTGADGAGRPAVEHLLALPSGDPLVLRELRVSAYHLLWELTHALLEHGPC